MVLMKAPVEMWLDAITPIGTKIAATGSAAASNFLVFQARNHRRISANDPELLADL